MTVLAGVLLASLLGSVHCGAMCSVFACAANGSAQQGAWYHGGRLAAYLMLGVVAGIAGAGLDRAGLIMNVQRSATFVTSATLIVWGSLRIQQALRPRRFDGASNWGGVLGKQLARTAHWDPRTRATAIGVTTGLLPCGWLWAFVVTAMGTGAPMPAAGVMAVFWMGTVPMLLAVAAGARRFGPVARVRWPLASAALVVALGIGQLASHLLMRPMRLDARHAQAHGTTR